MPAYPKNDPFYNWVPKPIGIIILFMFFLPILTVGGTYSASGTEMMSLVAEKVARGDTGARSGQGFYRWDEARHQRIQSRREHQLRFALKP